MLAIRVTQFGPPEVLKLETLPDPTPAPNQVLVRTRAIGVNPVEAYIRSGVYGAVPLPYTPGNDAAGIVESVGPGVRQFQPGQRVYIYMPITGAYAQLALCDAAAVHPLPDRVTFQQGAAIGVPYGTAYRALFHRGRAQPGETVLIHGASGGVGIAALQLARAAGLTVIGTAGSPRGKQLVADQGAHHVLDHTQPDYIKQITDITAGAGLPLILEMLANVNLGKDLTLLAPQGRVVVIGSRGPVEIDPRLTMSRDLDIRGMTLRSATPADLVSMHAALGAGLANGSLLPVIGQEIPLAEAPRAHQAVMSSGAYGKIVLIP